MNRGNWSAVAAYSLWGFFPIYFKLLKIIPTQQIVAHRLAWSFVFLLLVVAVRGEWGAMKTRLTPRALLISLLAGSLLTANWFFYIWGVNSGYILETSLGYFINPLVSVLLGVMFMREKLHFYKWIPIGLAAAGVLYLTVSYGKPPWIALALAFTFGFYGLIKKLSPLNSLYGLTVETAAIFLPALAYLVVIEAQGTGALRHLDAFTTILLALSGVITAVPLLLFATAARTIPLSTLGLLQYIAPTLQFFVGVWIYGENFSRERVVGFSIIWLALAIFSFGGMIQRKKSLLAAAAKAGELG